MTVHSIEEYEAALEDITQRGVAAIRSPRRTAGDVSNATEAGRDADRASKTPDSFGEAVPHSIKIRPYTTLAIAGLVGFIYGATRRRPHEKDGTR